MVSDIDRLFLDEMLKFGVLGSVKSHKLEAKNGTVLLTCGDCDRVWNVFKRHKLYLVKAGNGRCKNRIQPLSLNGGALLLARESMLNKKRREDLVLIDHALTALEIKDMNTVAVYSHYPCAAARKFQLSLEEVLRLTILGKRRLKKALRKVYPNVVLQCFFHVDNGKMATYFLCPKKWDEWVTKQDTEKASQQDMPLYAIAAAAAVF